MANEERSTYQFSTKPGIQRDGTNLDANYFNDGQHVRFQRGRPRKMGGYKAVVQSLTGPIRNVYVWGKQSFNSIFTFSPSKVEVTNVDSNGVGAVVVDRTPVVRTLTTTAITVVTGPITGGLLVTGTTSLSTAVIASFTGTTPTYTLTLIYVSAAFTNGEALTFTSGGTTVATGTAGVYTSTAMASDANTLWQVDSMYDAAANSNKTIIVAHRATNLVNIDDTTVSPIYIGDITALGALESIGKSVAGGIVAIAPYLVAYGADGSISWSNENEPANFVTGEAGTARITGAKIVKGLPVRGQGQSPSALFWSLDSVIRMYWIGGNAVFKFDTLSAQSSILSSNSVIEYDGVFFWIGVDRFMMFDGSVKELPNDMNQNFFFDNLNFIQKQKVWAMKVPRFGEVWWFYPSGDSTECDRALIYNVRLQVWYDTMLDRSAGYYSQVFRYPVMTSTIPEEDGFYSLWIHEIGTDKISGSTVTAIPSHFETSDFGLPTGGPTGEQLQGVNRWTRLTRVEPDFNQVGDMTMTVTGYEFAQGDYTSSEPYTFSPNTAKIDLREQKREIRLRFESNVQGGNYEMGKILLHIEAGDVRS